MFRQQWKEGVEGKKQDRRFSAGPVEAAADCARPLAYLMAWKVLVVLDFYIQSHPSSDCHEQGHQGKESKPNDSPKVHSEIGKVPARL